MVRTCAAVCCALVLLAATASAAFAAFPGRNGRIGFVTAGECGSNCFTGQIETVLPSGEERRVVVTDTARELDFSPDGRSIVYSTSEANSGSYLTLVRASGGGDSRLDTLDGFPSSPAWDPAGRRLVFVSYGGGSPSGEPPLWVYRRHQSDPPGRGSGVLRPVSALGRRPLTRGRYPAWSATNMIAFFRGDGLYLIRPDGTGLKRISNHPALFSGGQLVARHPNWSPDGRWLAFEGSDERVPGPSVFRINADGSGLQRLAQGGSPSFSPDGTSIAFLGVDGLMLMRPNGQQPRMIARVNAVATDWQPLPRGGPAERAGGGSPPLGVPPTPLIAAAVVALAGVGVLARRKSRLRPLAGRGNDP